MKIKDLPKIERPREKLGICQAIKNYAQRHTKPF